jgi:hypothetical protein
MESAAERRPDLKRLAVLTSARRSRSAALQSIGCYARLLHRAGHSSQKAPALDAGAERIVGGTLGRMADPHGRLNAAWRSAAPADLAGSHCEYSREMRLIWNLPEGGLAYEGQKVR